MKKALAVVSGDIHYNLNSLKIADAATRMAIAKANELKVPFIANGDVHDSKANMRGECVNALIETFRLCEIPPYINIGNHSRINEKSKEHSLNFLAPYGHIIDSPQFIDKLGLYIIPYNHDIADLRAYLASLPNKSTLVMHQGITGSNMGEYIKDHSAVIPKDVATMRVIASHYHNRQTIQLPGGGVWDYVGSPYTITAGEAHDEIKSFSILYSDGALDFIPTNLRRHRVWECTPDLVPIGGYTPGDILTIKIRGTHEELSGITRSKVQEKTGIEFFKLDLIPTTAETKAPEVVSLNQGELLDNLIDSLSNTSDDRKTNLKELWRRLGS